MPPNGSLGYQLAQQAGVPVLDYNSEGLVQRPDDFYDFSHTNYSGAVKVSHALASWLKNTYALPDHRGHWLYGKWDAAAGCYNSWQIAREKLPQAQAADVWLAGAGQLDAQYLVCVVQCSQSLTQNEAQQLASLGFSVSAGDAGFAGIVQDGNVLAEGGPILNLATQAGRVALFSDVGGGRIGVSGTYIAAADEGLQLAIYDVRNGHFSDCVLLSSSEVLTHLDIASLDGSDA